jgi:hypothetical protein
MIHIIPTQSDCSLTRTVIEIASQETEVLSGDWNEGSGPRSSVWCGIIVARRSSRQAIEIASRIRTTAPGRPVLLVADATPVVHRKRDLFDGVVSVGRARVDVRQRIRAVRSSTILAGIRLTAAIDQGLRPLARQAVRVAADPSASVTTVGALASALRVSRSTLWKAWHSSTGARGRLEDLIDWLILVKAVGAEDTRGWIDAATRVGVHEQTLNRIAGRSLGTTLREISRSAHGLMAQSSVVFVLSRFFSLELLSDVFPIRSETLDCESKHPMYLAEAREHLSTY